MTEPRVRGVVLPLCLAFVAGCSAMAVDVDRVAPGAEELPSDCPMRFFRDAHRLGDRCTLVGTLEVRDTGFSTDCGSDRIRAEVRKHGCSLGGNIAVLHRITGPMMTCVQSRAEVYACTEAPPVAAADGAGAE